MQRCPECGTEYPVSSGYCPMDGALLLEVPARAAGAEGWKLVLPHLVKREEAAGAPTTATATATAAAPVTAEPRHVAPAPQAGGPGTEAHGPGQRRPAPALRPAFAEVAVKGPAKTILAFGGVPAPEGEVRAARAPAEAAAPVSSPSEVTPVAIPLVAGRAMPAELLEAGLPAPEEALIGRILDQRYRLDAKLGVGGMGIVYRATHVIINKPLAVKVLRSEHARQPEVLQRFLLEAQLASQLKHPNVVDISDYGQIEGFSAYYVMEHLSGRTLAQELAATGRLAPARAVAVAIQVARGLGAAHDRGIVHRDLKPDNVFLGVNPEGGEAVKILDFGIARVLSKKTRLTAHGVVVGTPTYMSPEQAQSSSVDHRSDLYALGLILFEMLAGRPPFGDKGMMEVVNQHLFQAPPSLAQVAPDLPALPAIERVIRGLLAKDREERPQSAEEAIRLLEAAAASDLGEPVARGAATPAAAIPAESSASRRRAETVNLGSGSVVEHLAAQSGAGAAVSDDDALTQPRGDRLALAGAPAPPLEALAEDPDAAVPRQVTPSGRIEKRPSVIVRRGTPVERFVPPPRRPAEPTALAAALSSDALERRAPASPRRGPPLLLVIAVAAIVAMAITVTAQRFWPRGGRGGEAAAAGGPGAVEEIVVVIESTPSGATVLRGEEAVGVTPYEVRMPRGGAGAVYSVRMPGYVEVVRTIVPDRAQTIIVPLAPSPPPRADAAVAGASPTADAGATAPAPDDGASKAGAKTTRRLRPPEGGARPSEPGPSEAGASAPEPSPRPDGGELGDLKDPFARGGGG